MFHYSPLAPRHSPLTRLGHYALLIAVASGLFLPNLGGPSLWDIDEGNNATAAREMLEADNWIVPTFNYQLRVDKPALLYWLQIAAYRAFGINEFAARLPSAVAALLTVLLTYELGRQLFDAATGLLAGLVLASTVMFCVSAHFANPDALLNAATVLTLLFFWHGYATGGRWWSIPAGLAAAAAVLAKGPVGLLLPGAVITLFLLRQRRLCLLLDCRLLLGVLTFALAALPWYIWVGVDTKGDFLRGFFFRHNVGRYLSALENHRGPVYYYVVALAAGFLPWSVFLGPTAWQALGRRAHEDKAGAAVYQFLWCWFAVYFVFFSLAGTKLPNYILPLYPPVALLTARFFERWRRGLIAVPGWAFPVSLSLLALVGIGLAGGLLLASGVVPAPFLRGRQLPALSSWAVLGAVPVLGAAAAGWFLARQERGRLIAAFGTTAVILLGALAAGGSLAVDAYKAPRPLLQALHAEQAGPEIRIASYEYFQPSLVFYARREVRRLADERQLLEFLEWPLPVYVFLPAQVWEEVRSKAPAAARLVGRRPDLYRGFDVVLVSNR